VPAARVITCSDAASRGERVDKSGPAVRELLTANGYDVDAVVIVTDDVDDIAGAIESATNDGVRLVVTTGGTGIAARDVTPEATMRVCEKVIPGFGEIMRAASLSKTPMAPLSRAQAATRGTALIVNLPGSESGARENLQAVLHLIPHALQLLEGKTEHS
jgi:molybdenum cofactor synthesis domain-containing protein